MLRFANGLMGGLCLLWLAAALWMLPRGGEGEPRRVSGAMRALDHWAAQRTYPGKTFPSRGYAEAFAYAKRHLREVGAGSLPDSRPLRDGKSVPTAPWRSLGPHNIGGRTLAVVLNPQNPSTVYAGSASGGLWRSYTAGKGAAAWEYVPTGFPVLAVSAIAFAPDDSNVIYIGTGEVYAYQDTQGGIADRLTRGSYGIGILKSEDGGDTWSKSLDWSYNQERGVQVVRVDPQNPGVVWAGTTEGTYKSVDAGQTWDLVHGTIMVTDLVINPAQTNTVFIACGNLNSVGHGVFRTIDGGTNWTQMWQPAVIPGTYLGKALLSICESQPDVVFISFGNGGLGSQWTWLCRSDDSGASWSRVSVTDYSLWQGWFSHDVEVHPENPDIVITVGIDIWKSTTGGSNLVKKSDWTQWYFGQTIPGEPEGPPDYSHADHHDLVYHPTNRDIIYFANDGGIFRSLDGGETFEGCNGGYQTQQFYAGFSSSLNDSFVALGGMQDNSTAIYDGTDAWIRVIGGDGSWTAIDPVDDNVLYGSAQYLYMLKSTNQGGGWFVVEPPPTGTTSFIAPFGIGGPGAHRTLYAGRSIIYKSIDGAITWLPTFGGQELDGNPALALEVSQTDDNVAYVTTAPLGVRAGVFRTTDGDTWVDVTGSLPDRYPVGLAIDPGDDQIVYVTFSGFGTSHVFKSVSGGDTWQDIGVGLPDVPTSSVVVDPFHTDHVYLGNDLGVYFSGDGGATWQGYSLGLPDAVIAMDLTVSPTNQMLRCSTYGNGVYERELMSVLVDVPEVVPAAPVFTLAQNAPNPFNPMTVIKYRLYQDAAIELVVYDAAGRLVRRLVAEMQAVGEHRVRWDGRDERGVNVASGVYLYTLRVGEQVETKKMMVVR